MKILNIMLSRDLGGIQQAFIDHNHAWKLQNVEVINVTSLFAKIHSVLIQQKIWNFKLPNLGAWDIFSILYLKLLIKFLKPNAIIAHGNRAIKFSRNNNIVLIGVAHNYNTKWLKKCDYIIALTDHMKNYLIAQKFDKSKIIIIPNMIRIKKEISNKKYKDPVVIGTIARFVPKKGIDIFLHSLSKLKKQKYHFKAIIGGDGAEKNNLINLSKNLGLDNDVSFIGWVKDKDKFFEEIDIFCIPSLREPFGIVALEAMEACVPIVASRSEGLSEIIRDTQDGLLCDVGSSDHLAKNIGYLIKNQDIAHNLTISSYSRLKDKYDIKTLSLFLKNFITKIL